MARGAHGDRSVLGADCACSMLMGWTLLAGWGLQGRISKYLVVWA